MANICETIPFTYPDGSPSGELMWSGDPISSYATKYSSHCLFNLQIYTDSKVFRAVFDIGCGDCYNGYGLPFILKTPAFNSEEDCLDHYIQEGLAHCQLHAKRSCDQQLIAWIKALKPAQMEIEL